MGSKTRKVSFLRVSLSLVQVGIAGKYGARYGASLRKMAKKFESLAVATYVCSFCGKKTVRRKAGGIWNCRGCKIVVAGGCYSLTTNLAMTAKATITRLRRNIDEAEQTRKKALEEQSKGK